MKPVDIVFSFDTTGSMYPCLSVVRKQIAETVKELFAAIPNLRIGMIAHGDYCDHKTYVTKHLKLTSDQNALTYFVNNVERTWGGDAPECYELVLHEAQSFEWNLEASKLLVVIGDATPHPPAHNPKRLDWKEEVRALTELGVLVHGVQCLNGGRESDTFYQTMADMSGGVRVRLAQFNEAVEAIKAIAYNQFSPESFKEYEEKLVSEKKMTRSLDAVFSALSRRDPKTGRYRKVDARSVDIGRFQAVRVDTDTPIKELVESIGATFEKGRGFYQFTKREEIQGYKQIILMDNESGDMFEGAAAREVLGLPAEGTIKMTPTFGEKWTVFVQSTSVNRKLIGGTKFLYEAPAT